MKQTKEQQIEKISQRSGISRATVFRYLAGKTIRQSSEEAILQADKELSLNLFSRDTGEGKDILVSISPRFDIFKGYAEALSGVMHKAEEAGISIKLNRDIAQDSKGSGVIIIGKSEEEEEEEITLLLKQGIPFVLINRLHAHSGISWVSVDNRKAAREGCEHLLANGYRRIGFWGGEQGIVAEEKQKGYLDAFQDYGLSADPDLIFNQNEISLDEAFNSAMGTNEQVDAWLAIDDEIAAKIIRLAIGAGFSIPDDFGVCSMNDIESTTANIIPSLTSVKIPFRKMGMAAVDILLELQRNPLFNSMKTYVKHELVVRDSSTGKKN